MPKPVTQALYVLSRLQKALSTSSLSVAILTKKSTKRKRHLRGTLMIAASDLKLIHRMLGCSVMRDPCRELNAVSPHVRVTRKF